MKDLIVSKALKRGDTIALISISGGRAGDEDMLYRYEIGKKRLEDILGEISPCKECTNIEWRNVSGDEIKWIPNPGYCIIQGKGVIRGRIFGGCASPLQQIIGTEFFPTPEFF